MYESESPALGEAGLSMEKRAGRGGTAGFLTMSTGAEEGSIDNFGASVPDQAASEMEAGIA